ncbi:cupin domain-containing protein [Streptomyces sp. SP18CS02]|uniref:cupin domain-containing protein n=1 Tax=Streptomyces sp. SP18CS02 TaxID=3002531 RepID=UPI002E77A075|nr:hypothetical protein [Streptomyces sp. SP18CS02]MEE1754221.1 hypothetical protein [Streptomyces sp. SP18CS02]
MTAESGIGSSGPADDSLVPRILCDIRALIGPDPAPEPAPTSSAPEPDPASPSAPEPAPTSSGPEPAVHPARSGALWRLAEPGRQLDSNLVRIPPSGRIGTHTEPEVDVLLVVVSGEGTLSGPAVPDQPLTEGVLAWLPRGSTRSVAAGDRGLSYLTVHRRRPGMQIRPAPR